MRVLFWAVYKIFRGLIRAQFPPARRGHAGRKYENNKKIVSIAWLCSASLPWRNIIAGVKQKAISIIEIPHSYGLNLACSYLGKAIFREAIISRFLEHKRKNEHSIS